MWICALDNQNPPKTAEAVKIYKPLRAGSAGVHAYVPPNQLVT